MTTRGQDIASVIKRQIEEFGAQLTMVDVGTVVEVGDGIARVHGLSGVAYNELVEFEGGVVGLALNLEEDSVGVVIMGDPLSVKEGTEVRSTGRIVEVPVGDALIGRVVDALGPSTARVRWRPLRRGPSKSSPPTLPPASPSTPPCRRASRP